jgi:hypothetical protein
VYHNISASFVIQGQGILPMALQKCLIWPDEVVLLPIYPARELAIEGTVNSELILK